MFPTEAEQIQSIIEAESVQAAPFASSLPQEDIDHLLRLGSNTEQARLKIVNEFMKQKPFSELTAFIQGVDAVLEAIYDRQEQERLNAEMVARIKCCLSETQFRRLWLFRVEGLTVREIAKQEHISFQCVHKSVCAAEKKIAAPFSLF